MRKEHALDLLMIDIETDGSDPTINEIVQIGAMMIDRETLKVKGEMYESLVYASLDNSQKGAMKVHGILPSDIWDAPPGIEVYNEILDLYPKNKTVLCGWNIKGFDALFMKKAFLEAELPWGWGYHIYDLAPIFIWVCDMAGIKLDSYSLDSAVELLGVKGRGKKDYHGALDDCIIQWRVMKAMKELTQ